MRIALIHTRFGPGGGVEAYLRRLTERLRETGHELHFFGRYAAPRDAPFTFHRVRCLPVPQSLRILSFGYRAAHLARREAFDVTFGLGRTFGHDLHRDSNGAFAPFQKAVAPSLRRSSLYRLCVLHLERKLYCDPALLHTVCVSEFVRNQILARYPLDPSRVTVVRNGIECPGVHTASFLRTEVRQRLQIPQETLLALFVGHDWRRKGLHTVLHALKESTAWHLWVLGEDKEKRYFLRTVRRWKLAQRVRFLGSRPPQEYYAAADAFVFPSLFDPSANVVPEAMAWGLPVVVSPTDGASELVRDGESGFVLSSPTDRRALCACLGKLQEAQVRARLGAQAKKAVEGLTWERHFDQLVPILNAVAEEKRSRQGVDPVTRGSPL